MTTIYLIRHAEAEGNLYRRIHGWYDGRLTAMGTKQTAALEKRFENVHIDAVYSSDLTRAKDTARSIYVPKALPLHEREELREVGMGVWEDKCWGYVAQYEPQQLSYLNFEPEKWSVEGCEPYADSLERMERALFAVAGENEGKTVAVFSHGSIIRILLAKLLGWSSGEIKKVLYCDNTAVAKILADGGRMELEYYNDNSHLPAEISAFHRDTWWKDENAKDGRDMYFLPMDVFGRGEEYLRRYRDAWICSHGSDIGFSDIYLQWARGRCAEDKNSVMEAYLGDEVCGMLELAPSSGEAEGYGHIALLYLEERFRGRGLAVQLLGQAVSYYRNIGRHTLRLRVAESNTAARAFYGRWGFEVTETEWGMLGNTLTMCRPV